MRETAVTRGGCAPSKKVKGSDAALDARAPAWASRSPMRSATVRRASETGAAHVTALCATTVAGLTLEKHDVTVM